MRDKYFITIELTPKVLGIVKGFQKNEITFKGTSWTHCMDQIDWYIRRFHKENGLYLIDLYNYETIDEGPIKK